MVLIVDNFVLFTLEYSPEDLLNPKRPCDNMEDETKLTFFSTDSFMLVYQSIHMHDC